MSYFAEAKKHSVNEVNRERFEGFAKDLNFYKAEKPEYLSSDLILYTDKFESVIFVSANRRVNPDFIGKLYEHEDGFLYQVGTGRQQLAVFFWTFRRMFAMSL